ncbi:MAG: rRNA pseudouridine synthase [Nitrospinae bacterium]|nr:rRNA pseudouridine synthase [Nitrospinota bacterium]
MGSKSLEKEGIRLQKILSQAGVASRRKAEEMILEGRVSVNGQVVGSLGTKADPLRDKIKVDGKPLRKPEPKAYLLLNKPRGYLTSMAVEEERPTIAQLLKGVKVRVFPVGRLDYDAEGVLLLTNDGELALTLSHPRYEIPRRYLVKVRGIPSPDRLKEMKRGLRLEDGWASALATMKEVTDQDNSWLEITVREGRNHLVKRLCQRIGHPVQRLKRIQYSFLTAEGLKPGTYRFLTSEEIQRLQELASRKRKLTKA